MVVAGNVAIGPMINPFGINAIVGVGNVGTNVTFIADKMMVPGPVYTSVMVTSYVGSMLPGEYSTVITYGMVSPAVIICWLPNDLLITNDELVVPTVIDALDDAVLVADSVN